MIAFGGFSWALDGASAPVGAVMQLGAAMRQVGELPQGHRMADAKLAFEIRFRDVAPSAQDAH